MRFDAFMGGSGMGALASQTTPSRTANMYLEVLDPSERTKTNRLFRTRPGLLAFATLGSSAAVTALLEVNGRCFAVAGGSFYELLSDGTTLNYTKTSGVSIGLGRAQMCASQDYVLILCAGVGFTFALASNVLATITSPNFPTGAVKAAYMDEYFVVLSPNSKRFNFSSPNDPTTWAALDYVTAEGEQGNAVTLIADHRYLWILCNTHTVIYYDAGNANSVFQRLEGGFSEQGCGAIDSVAQFDQSLIWVGQNRDGGGVVWRSNGFIPVKVSTHAVELALQNATTYSDAVGYVYQQRGHSFYVLTLPSANSGNGATWVYDLASGEWTEWFYWNSTKAIEQAHLGRTHCYAFGLHLVGDWQSGTVYIQSPSYVTDAGAEIQKSRTTPALTADGQRMYFQEFRLQCEVGVGLDGGLTPGSNPVCSLAWSNDGGKTWSPQITRTLGALGAYRTILRWVNLGSSSNRVFRWQCSEPIKISLLAANLDMAPEVGARG